MHANFPINYGFSLNPSLEKGSRISLPTNPFELHFAMTIIEKILQKKHTLFADETTLFADENAIFADETSLFADENELFADAFYCLIVENFVTPTFATLLV